MSATNFTLKKGDTHYLEVLVTRKDQNEVDQPVDLTGAKMWFTAKNRITDTDIEAVIRKGTNNASLSGVDITGAVDGEALVTLQPADTTVGKGTVFLFWDLQLEESDGTITTLNAGRLALSDQVTLSS